MWGGLGPWLRFWQRVRDGLCAGGAGCAQRLVRRGGGAQQLVPGTGRVRNGCAQRLVCRGGGATAVPGGCAQRLEGLWRGGRWGSVCAVQGVRNGLCAGGGVRNGLCAGGGWCATGCVWGVCAQRVVRGPARLWLAGGRACAGGLCAQRLVPGAGGRFGRKFWIASGVNFGSLGA